MCELNRDSGGSLSSRYTGIENQLRKTSNSGIQAAVARGIGAVFYTLPS